MTRDRIRSPRHRSQISFGSLPQRSPRSRAEHITPRRQTNGSLPAAKITTSKQRSAATRFPCYRRRKPQWVPAELVTKFASKVTLHLKQCQCGTQRIMGASCVTRLFEIIDACKSLLALCHPGVCCLRQLRGGSFVSIHRSVWSSGPCPSGRRTPRWCTWPLAPSVQPGVPLFVSRQRPIREHLSGTLSDRSIFQYVRDTALLAR